MLMARTPFFSSIRYCLDNFIVRDTPAVMPGKGLFDCLLSRERAFVQQCLGTHQDAGCAETALKRRIVNKSLLKGVQFTGFPIFKTLYGGHVLFITFHGQGHAG